MNKLHICHSEFNNIFATLTDILVLTYLKMDTTVNIIFH